MATVQDDNYDAWFIFSEVMRIFSWYVAIPILIFGLSGNVLSMCIFFAKRHQDKVSAMYLGPLGFFDFWNNCKGCYYWLVAAAPSMTGGKFGMESYGESDVGCWLAWFFHMVGMYMSGFIIVLFSAERCLAIWFPLKMAPNLTPKNRRNALLCLLLIYPFYSVVTVSHYGYFHGDNTTTKGCPVRPGTPLILEILFWFGEVALGSLIPCSLVVILNITLLIGIRKGNREMEKSKTADQKTANQEKRCLRNLMLVSLFYVIFMFPYGVMWSMTASAGSQSPRIHAGALYSLQWSSINYCINPILYCYSLPYYRETAVKVITCGLVGHSRRRAKSLKS